VRVSGPTMAEVMGVPAYAGSPGAGRRFVLLSCLVALVAMLVSLAPVSAKLCWNVAWTASAAAAVGGTLIARSAAGASGLARWTLWAAAAISWLGGQLVWDVFVVFGFLRSPNLADVGYWGFAVLVIISLVRVRGRPSPLQAVTAAEMLPLIASVTALTLALLWSDVSQSSLPWISRVSALAYPAVYVAAALLTLQAMIGGSLRRDRSAASLLILGGIVAQAVAFILWSHQLLRGTNVPGGSLLSPLWVIGLIAIAIGGLLAARDPDAVDVVEEPGRRGGVLPAAMFILLTAALVRAWFSHAPRGAVVVLAAAMLLCGVSLIVRSALLQRRLLGLLGAEHIARLELSESRSQLATLNERLVEASRRDSLTGLRNRRALSDDLPMLEAVDGERGRAIAFALCDIDHFKSYNDRLGHLAGDQALREIASIVRSSLRAGDVAYRFGGEELLLVLRDMTPQEALEAAERVRADVLNAGLRHLVGSQEVLTVSIGVSAGPGDAGTLLANADAALRAAKRQGRNRVAVIAGPGERDARGGQRALLAAEPVPRHLRSMLTISRAAVSGRGAIPVLEALAAAIRSELSFATVVVKLLDAQRRVLRAVVVLGDENARRTMLGSVTAWPECEALIDSDHARCGAVWLPAESAASQRPGSMHRAPAAGQTADSWQPGDTLLLPMRGSSGAVLGIVSVDEPLSGRRPHDAELSVLMAVADHAGLALEQALREASPRPERKEQPQELLLAAVMLLAETLDLRDEGTAQHSRIVGTYARQTAAALALPADRIEQIYAAGVVHDVGKVGIADAIIFKPGPLTPEEYREMQKHAEIGARILEHAGIFDIAGWVRAHHERLDGEGYPRGLSGQEIALEPRILAVADAYEAMTANRPYRTAMPAAAARAELKRCSGAQFDPVVVDAFLGTLVDEESVAAPLSREVSSGIARMLSALPHLRAHS
jgi:diguanylate cyclase (GGDEF)-like protein